MYPELWLHDLARERQREIREFAARSARRGNGEEYLARIRGHRRPVNSTSTPAAPCSCSAKGPTPYGPGDMCK